MTVDCTWLVVCLYPRAAKNLDVKNAPPARKAEPKDPIGPLHNASVIRVRDSCKRLLGQSEPSNNCCILSDEATCMRAC